MANVIDDYKNLDNLHNQIGAIKLSPTNPAYIPVITGEYCSYRTSVTAIDKFTGASVNSENLPIMFDFYLSVNINVGSNDYAPRRFIVALTLPFNMYCQCSIDIQFQNSVAPYGTSTGYISPESGLEENVLRYEWYNYQFSNGTARGYYILNLWGIGFRV